MTFSDRMISHTPHCAASVACISSPQPARPAMQPRRRRQVPVTHRAAHAPDPSPAPDAVRSCKRVYSTQDNNVTFSTSAVNSSSSSRRTWPGLIDARLERTQLLSPLSNTVTQIGATTLERKNKRKETKVTHSGRKSHISAVLKLGRGNFARTSTN